MSYRLRRHPRLPYDLEAIDDRLASYADLEVAARKLDVILDTIEALALNPHRGTERRDVGEAVRAVPAGRQAVVVFRIDEATRTVLVLTVGYGGLDWRARARQRLR